MRARALVAASVLLASAVVFGQSEAEPDAEAAVVSEEPRPEPFVALRTIVIDAGHGAQDGGAVGVLGIPEKWFTLRTSLALAERLRSPPNASSRARCAVVNITFTMSCNVPC